MARSSFGRPKPTERLERKLVILGSAGSGKTALSERKSKNLYSELTQPTINCDKALIQFEIDKPDMVFSLDCTVFDTAGGERYTGLLPIHMKNSHVVFIVFDMTNNASFEKIQEYVDLVSDKEAPIYLVGTKSDAKEKWAVSEAAAKKKAEEVTKQNDRFFLVSAKQDAGINDLFDRMAQQIVDIEHQKRINYQKAGVPIHDAEPGISKRDIEIALSAALQQLDHEIKLCSSVLLKRLGEKFVISVNDERKKNNYLSEKEKKEMLKTVVSTQHVFQSYKKLEEAATDPKLQSKCQGGAHSTFDDCCDCTEKTNALNIFFYVFGTFMQKVHALSECTLQVVGSRSWGRLVVGSLIFLIAVAMIASAILLMLATCGVLSAPAVAQSMMGFSLAGYAFYMMIGATVAVSAGLFISTGTQKGVAKRAVKISDAAQEEGQNLYQRVAEQSAPQA